MKISSGCLTSLSKISCAVITSLYLFSCSVEQGPSQLTQQFNRPPDSAKPRVWWHWMNGNITKEGIAADLAWMNRVGIGGVQNFDANLMTPLIVDKRIVYMTDEWLEMFKFALAESDKYNFEFAIAASPGWSETGGPWVKPQDGMKKVVWSETLVSSEEANGNIKLKAPSKTTGIFQDFGASAELFAAGNSDHPSPQYYADIAVLAVPVDSPEPSANLLNITDSKGNTVDGAALFDHSYQTSQTFSSDQAAPTWLQFNYATKQVFRSASLAMPPPAMFMPVQLLPKLQASLDGQNFVDVASFPVDSGVQYTLSFPAVEAQYLRLVFEKNNSIYTPPSSSAPGAKPPAFFAIPSGKPSAIDFSILELAFTQQNRVHRFEEKAAYAIAEDYYPLSQQNDIAGLPLSRVIDLTDKLQADGSSDWRPESGQWKILRMGYSLTGKENHPAIPEATGLEVDKYDPIAVKQYINDYLDLYQKLLGADNIGKKGINALLNDSIESGASNWTPALLSEFNNRRGYDMRPWLPALTGLVLENTQKTDAFLYDFRKTLAELIEQNHYGVITEEVHKRGLTHYSEALENARPSLGDGMAMRKHADIPMAAMWAFDTANNIGPQPQYWSDIREAASVAHIYGQNIVAAESLTSAMSPWAFAPSDLKPMIDMEFALGVNRPIIHTSVHQPLTDKAPGFTLFIFGQYFNRLETWAEYAKPWVSYISRNAFMLQQGRFAADVAYFYGEETPLTALYNDAPPTDVPTEHGFDYINTDVILNQLKNDGNELVTASGARYKVIYLGGTSHYMSLAVLEKLADLVKNGAILIGHKPLGSPTLMDDPLRFSELADELWSGKYAKQVIASDSIKAGLAELKLAADFSYQAKDDSTIMFVHRTSPTRDIYYFSNRNAHSDDVSFKFRVTGKQPMLYDAVTGKTRALSYRTEGGHTVIDYALAGFESGYIVFENSTSKTSVNNAATVISPLLQLDGEWLVSFQADRGAPVEAQSMSLGDWSTNADPGIKYFSGTASYSKTFNLSQAEFDAGDSIELDLGDVSDVAEVIVNGKSAGIVWTTPYQLDIKPYLQSGDNQLEIKVTNLWVNRLIGDNQPEVQQTYTFVTGNSYFPNAPLRKSGLLGPVTINSKK